MSIGNYCIGSGRVVNGRVHGVDEATWTGSQNFVTIPSSCCRFGGHIITTITTTTLWKTLKIL